jgi:hypothetical protein
MMLYCQAVFSIEDGGEGYKLINRSVVFHLDDRLELLNESSVKGEGIVSHIVESKQYTFFIDVIDDLNLIVTLATINESIVDDGSVEPSGVIKDIFLLEVVTVIELACKIV